MISSEESNNNSSGNPQEVKFRLICYADDVGNMIGEAGSKIKSIKEESKCYIKFVGPTWKGNRLLHISGSSEGVGKAIELISMRLIEARKERAEKSQLDDASKEFVSLRFLIPASQCGALIGEAGATISQIKKDTNTRIGIDPTSLPFSNDRICRLSGTPTDLAKCFVIITALLDKNPPKKNHKNFKILPKVPNDLHNIKTTNGTSTECNTMKLHLSKTLIGSLIGKGGCHINQIRDFTGAKIEINTTAHPDESEIVISGNSKAVAAANFFVDARLTAVNYKKPVNGKKVGPKTSKEEISRNSPLQQQQQQAPNQKQPQTDADVGSFNMERKKKPQLSSKKPNQ